MMGRRARQWLLAACTFVVADVLAARAVLHVWPEVDAPPPEVEERQYRVESALYDHDLASMFDGFARWGPVRYHIATNSLGFKDARRRTVPLASARPRLLLLGDSFTEGIGLDYRDTYAGRIANGLGPRRVEVLNAAVSSYSPAIYYAKLRYLLEDLGLQCSDVAVFIDISDVEDEARLYDLHADARVTRMVNQTPGRGAEYGAGPEEDEHVPPTLAAAGRAARAVETEGPRGDAAPPESAAASPDRPPSLLALRLRRNSVSVRLFDTLLAWWRPSPPGRGTYPQGGPRRGLWTIDERDYDAFGRLGLQRAAQHMHELATLLRRHHIPLRVAVYPWPDQIRYDDADSIQLRYWRDWSARHGARFVDAFSPFFRDADREAVLRRYYINGDVHFNREGSRLVATAFLDALAADVARP
jgi:hypothetical protein